MQPLVLLGAVLSVTALPAPAVDIDAAVSVDGPLPAPVSSPSARTSFDLPPSVAHPTGTTFDLPPTAAHSTGTTFDLPPPVGAVPTAGLPSLGPGPVSIGSIPTGLPSLGPGPVSLSTAASSLSAATSEITNQPSEPSSTEHPHPTDPFHHRPPFPKPTFHLPWPSIEPPKRPFPLPWSEVPHPSVSIEVPKRPFPVSVGGGEGPHPF